MTDESNFTFTSTQNVTWSPQVKGLNTPDVTGGQDSTNPYWWVFSYQYFADLVNEALDDAFQDLGTQGYLHPFGCIAPFIEFNEDSLTFSLYAQEDFYGTNQESPIKIFFNEALQLLFPNFKYNRFNAPKLTFQYLPSPKLSRTNIMTISDISGNVIQTRQEFPNLVSWNVCDRIVVTTDLPILHEATTTTAAFGTTTKQPTQGDENINILTDFQVTLGTGIELFQGEIYYNPSGQYRYAVMNSTRPIKRMTVSIWWSDIYGNLYPFYLQEGNGANLKLMFVKKSAAK